MWLSALAVLFHAIVLSFVSAEQYWLFLSVGTPAGLATVAYTIFVARRYVEFGEQIVVQRLLWKRTIDWSNVSEVRHEVLVQEFHDEQYPPSHAICLRLIRGKMRSVGLDADEALKVLTLAARRAPPGTLIVDRQRYPNELWMKVALVFAGTAAGGVAAWLAWTMHEEIVWGTLSKSWPRVESTLLSSELKTRLEPRRGRGKYDYSYTPHVIFSYTVNGSTYEGDRIRFSTNTFDEDGPARKQLARLKAEVPLLVHYNPQNPAMSVVLPGVTWYRYFMFAGLIGLSVGCWCYAAWTWLKHRGVSANPGASLEFRTGERR